MSVVFEILDDSTIDAYDSFVRKHEQSLVYHSVAYRNFLKKFLKKSQDFYILGYDNDELVAVLPTFCISNNRYKVLNSLPFYGSNGGVLIRSDYDAKNIYSKILGYLNDFCSQELISAYTVVTSPYEKNFNLYEQYTSYDTLDSRIGQITFLPNQASHSEIPNVLMNLFHTKTRNMVRKGLKYNFKISPSGHREDFDFLFNTHKKNIESIGGIFKPKEVFDSVITNFQRVTDYDIWIARDPQSEERIAALLILYFNKTVEYFTPVILEDFRHTQVLSALIFKAMIESTKRGYSYWNWGGTWHSQEGVYRFKQRWGSHDLPYFYYTKVLDKSLLDLKKEDILALFPYYYVYPFKNGEN